MSLWKHAATGIVCATLAGVAVHRLSLRPTPPPATDSVMAPRAESSTALVSAPPASEPVAAATDPLLAALAAENAELHARLADADKERNAAQEAFSRLRRSMSIDRIRPSLRATVRPGESIVTGGTLLPDGRRLYVFTKPTRLQDAMGDGVTIESRIVAMNDAAMSRARLESLSASDQSPVQPGEVWVPGEAEAALQSAEATGGVEFLSSPRITQLIGTESMISLNDRFVIHSKPTLAADGSGLDMELRMEWMPAAPGSP